jgi:hypothetical protein
LCEIICVCYEVLPRVEIKCPQDTLLSAVEQIKPAAHSPRKRIAAFESTNAKHKEAVRKCLMLDSNQSLSRRGCCVEGTKPMAHRPNRPPSASKMGIPRTTASRYRKHTLFSRPYYDENLGVWMSYASVVPDVFGDGERNNTYHHEMKDGNQSFEREEQALSSASSLVAVGLTNISPMRQ